MRIEGVKIPDDKHVEISLTKIYGIGRARARTILEETGVDPHTDVKDLSADDEKKIRKAVEEYAVEGDLRRQVSGNIKRLKDIDSYRGDRHSKNLPVRGQKTRTNARNVPDGIRVKNRDRVTMGSGRRTVEKK